jgi:hypothetical protein
METASLHYSATVGQIVTKTKRLYKKVLNCFLSMLADTQGRKATPPGAPDIPEDHCLDK